MSENQELKDQLLNELAALQQQVAELGAAEKRQQILSRVREKVWEMRSHEEIDQVLAAVREGLHALGIPFHVCGVNIVDPNSDLPHGRSYDTISEGRWTESREMRGRGLIQEIWQKGEVLYRRDLSADDAHEETSYLEDNYEAPIRSVVDVPFSQGTFAVNSLEPNAFSEQHIRDLQALAGVLSEGFQRLADLRRLEQRNRMLEAVNAQLQQEIAERQQVEKTLRESEARIRLITDNVPGLIAYVDRDMTYRFVNKGYERWFGMGREAFIDKRVDELLDENAFERSFPFIEKALGGEEARFDGMAKLPDGSTKYFVNHLVPDISADGIVEGYFVLVSDITEHKRAEEALRESEERYRLLVEQSPLGIALLSSKGENLFLNDSFKRMFGYTLEDIPTGRDWFTKAYPDEELRKSVKERWLDDQKNRKAGVVRSRIFDVTCKDGTLKTIHFRPVTMEDEKQFIIYEDITDRRRLEEEQRRIHNLESLGVLAGGIAHDFNNVLTGVIGNLSLLEMMLEKEDESRVVASETREAADRTRELTRQLMTFARGGAPVKETASIEALLKETASISLRGSNTRPEYHFPADLLPVHIDRGQVGQVIQNLVLNADQAMPQGGILTIAAENREVANGDSLPLTPGSYVKISVEDRGVGIPENVLGNIFDPYFSTKQSGHGLGLAITHSIVTRHEGHIAVRSETGVGTTFEIYLPASEQAVVPAAAPPEPELARGTGRILLMDDEEIIHHTLSRMLERLGYTVDSVYDGDEALRVYGNALETDHPYDAVIMDLTIPGGKGGKEAITELREIDPRARALVSSGYSNDPVMASYADYGFCGTIEKPVYYRKLADVVKQALTAD
ncbi:MAG: PAS domain S-box protein [Gemmatimonadetes bacterium]|jgi:two-component system, cell cycle sensor histidine kinase and response regulator CckA|nr:PAS domain S-box protein [Gemmatimonadota bacterium]